MQVQLRFILQVALLAFVNVSPTLILASPVNQVSLKIDAAVTVRLERILLRDIVQCTAPLNVRCQEIGTVDLGASAEPGNYVNVRREHIIQVLLAEYPHLELNIESPQIIKIETGFQKPSESSLRSIIEGTIGKVFARQDDYKYELEQVFLPTNVFLPDVEGEYRVPELDKLQEPNLEWYTAAILALRNLEVEFVAFDGRVLKRFPLKIQLNVYRQIPVAARTLKKGQAIRNEDLLDKWLSVERLNQNMLLQRQQILGKTLQQSVRLGKPLYRNALAEPILVQRGQQINVIFRQGMVEIKTKGKAMRSGAFGEIIPVELAGSKKTMQGKIREDEAVAVQF